MQDAPQLLRLPDEGRASEAPHAHDLVNLTMRVAQMVSMPATVVWLWLWDATGFRPGLLPRVTLASVAAVARVTRGQASRIVSELDEKKLIEKLERDNSPKGGLSLRVVEPDAILRDDMHVC